MSPKHERWVTLIFIAAALTTIATFPMTFCSPRREGGTAPTGSDAPKSEPRPDASYRSAASRDFVAAVPMAAEVRNVPAADTNRGARLADVVTSAPQQEPESATPLPVVAASPALSAPRAAAVLWTEARPIGGARTALVVMASPVPFNCGLQGYTCFRVSLKISSNGGEPVAVQGLDRDSMFLMHNDGLSTGQTNAGGQCFAANRGGLPKATLSSDGQVQWRGEPLSVGEGAEARYMLEFSCEDPDGVAASADLQITLAVGSVGARSPRIARYGLTDVALN